MGQHIGKLISTKTTLKGRENKHKRQRLQNKINSLFIRIRNLIDEVHKKVAKWLTTEYRVIFSLVEIPMPLGRGGCQVDKLSIV